MRHIRDLWECLQCFNDQMIIHFHDSDIRTIVLFLYNGKGGS